MNYLIATVLAVEAAILHNFVWHERWTWADRLVRAEGETTPSRASRVARLLRFNGIAALVSIGGNVTLMSLLVAMALAVAALSAVNFACADRLIFTD